MYAQASSAIEKSVAAGKGQLLHAAVPENKTAALLRLRLRAVRTGGHGKYRKKTFSGGFLVFLYGYLRWNHRGIRGGGAFIKTKQHPAADDGFQAALER